MNKKLKKFIKGFNVDVDDSGMDRYLFLELVDTGFQKAIAIPEGVLWTDESSEEFAVQHVLSQLVSNYGKILKVARKRLKKEIDKYLHSRLLEFEEVGGFVSMSRKLRGDTLILYIHTHEKFDENELEFLADKVRESLKYIFAGLKVTVNYVHDGKS